MLARGGEKREAQSRGNGMWRSPAPARPQPTSVFVVCPTAADESVASPQNSRFYRTGAPHNAKKVPLRPVCNAITAALSALNDQREDGFSADGW